MTRKALRPNRARRAVSKTHTIPSQTGGWVTNETISSMKPDQAFVMDNWFPHTNSAGIRRGFKQHATTPASGNVETLMNYKSGANAALFAAADGNIYDVTAGDAVSADVSGLGGSQLYWTNFATSGGQFLIVTSGLDPVQNYNGTVWATTPAITGVTGGTLIFPWSYRERLFFCQVGSADVWALPVDSIGGAAIKVALGGFLKLGGSIIAGTTWTLDAGEGPDDYCVFVSSEGEVLIFQGTDPSVPTSWEMKGQYRIGRPLGRRCLVRIGAEVGILCADGVVQLTRILTRDRTSKNETALTWNIQNTFNTAYKRWGGNSGWQTFNYPESNMVITNIPTSSGTMSEQYVMNSINGAWCRFTGIKAFHWASHDEKLFFGGVGGTVYQGDTTSSDNGAAIQALLIPAFSAWGAKGQYKQAGLIRPVLTGEISLIPSVVVLADYNIQAGNVTQSLLTVGSNTPLWDTALWDEALWPFLDGGVSTNWAGGANGGHMLSVAVAVGFKPENATDEYDFRLNEVNCIYEPGGMI